MTSPADELRTAATRLRALATAASTDGRNKPTTRWHFAKRDDRTGYLYAETPDGPAIKLLLGGSSGPYGRGMHPGMRTQHGEYAAAMDPAVGLALADWLEHEAAGHEAVQGLGNVTTELLNIELEQDGYAAQITHSTLQQALAVARAILGGQP
ncbi:hypothetical protein [Streptomyces sp. NPDC086519]|uniref:hypothetical protein n=1 Tax=Streptomyces sp. NPDC086519 TaxID=3154863 RepID=UPI003443FBF8